MWCNVAREERPPRGTRGKEAVRRTSFGNRKTRVEGTQVMKNGCARMSLAAGVAALVGTSAQMPFDLMQIEQVIGGVGGDTQPRRSSCGCGSPLSASSERGGSMCTTRRERAASS